MFAKVDLRNLFHFLTLRRDAHAQYEIRVYADAMLRLIRPIVPIATSAWEEESNVRTRK
jgi:thymidylate synthase (FAD)